MRIVRKDLKNGVLTLKLDNPDDAWKLDSVLDEGDLISGRTMRSTEVLRGDKKERGGKKPVFLKIILEKKEFHEYSGNLRLTGKIIEGPEDTAGSYHTFGADEGTVITVKKEWKKWQLEKIRKSQNAQPKILVCVMDEREALFAEIGERIKILAEISNPRAGKQFGAEYARYFSEIISFMKNRKFDRAVIAGPGFAKEDVYAKIKQEPEISGNVVMENCSHTGETGVQEIIRRGAVEKALKDSRIAEETGAVESFLTELSKDGKVTYGKVEVEKAVDMGAVEMLLVSEKCVRESEKLMEKAEKNGAQVFVVSELHESGQKLYNMGGLAAFLRFKIQKST